MKRMVIFTLALSAAAALGGCADTPRDNAAARGGLLGAATGALVGAAVTGRAGGALAGAAVGGAAGAIGAAAATPQDEYRSRPSRRRCARFSYDYAGNRICREFYYD